MEMYRQLLGLVVFGASIAGIFSFANTTNNIHVFLAYDTAITVNDVAYIAPNYDFVWAASPARVASFKSGNPNIVLSSYIPFNRDPDATHNLAYWKNFHPDWILYQCDQATPVQILGDANIGLDISNSDVVQWQVQQYAQKAAQDGYHMMALDNVALNNVFAACGIFRNGAWVQLYTGAFADSTFRTDVLNWLTNFRNAINPLKLGIAVHYRPSYSRVDSTTLVPDENDIIQRSDVVVDGGGFTNFGSGLVNQSEWKYTVDFMLNTQAQGKAYIIFSNFPVINSTMIDWILASYLMGKNSQAAVYITVMNNGLPIFGNDNWYNEFGAQIGYALGAYSQPTGTYYRRDFSNGIAFVNFGADATIDLGATLYYDLRGANYTGTITVPSQSGVVLMINYIVNPPFVPVSTTSAASSIFGLLPASLLLIALLFLLF